MRAPRYRFPDEVRDATRTMATQMVRDDRMARGPADLDAWLIASPEMHAAMQRGGYGTAFSAEDLFPLLQVMMTNAGGTLATFMISPTPSMSSVWNGSCGNTPRATYSIMNRPASSRLSP